VKDLEKELEREKNIIKEKEKKERHHQPQLIINQSVKEEEEVDKNKTEKYEVGFDSGGDGGGSNNDPSVSMNVEMASEKERIKN
jgi:hypothetical protein